MLSGGRRAVAVLKAAARHDVIIPTQVAGELYNILTRTGGHPPKVARKIAKAAPKKAKPAKPAKPVARKVAKTRHVGKPAKPAVADLNHL